MAVFPELTTNQVRALRALIECRTMREAAKQSGIGLSSMQRWMSHDPAFQQAWKLARQRMMEEAISASQRYSADACHVLARLMQDDTQSGATRVAAARAVLEVALKGLASTELEERVLVLQQQVRELQRHAYPPSAA